MFIYMYVHVCVYMFTVLYNSYSYLHYLAENYLFHTVDTCIFLHVRVQWTLGYPNSVYPNNDWVCVLISAHHFQVFCIIGTVLQMYKCFEEKCTYTYTCTCSCPSREYNSCDRSQHNNLSPNLYLQCTCMLCISEYFSYLNIVWCHGIWLTKVSLYFYLYMYMHMYTVPFFLL